MTICALCCKKTDELSDPRERVRVDTLREVRELRGLSPWRCDTPVVSCVSRTNEIPVRMRK